MNKLIISKSSWHFRWYSFLRDKFDWEIIDRYPSSLCSYFWSFIFSNIGALMVSLLIISGGALFATFIFLMTLGLPVLAWSAFHNGSKDAHIFFIVFSVFDVAILAAMLYCFLNSKFKNTLKDSIILNLILAVKRKACPLIEYKD